MGNQGSSPLTDEPNTIAQRNLQHFDHSFKADLHTVAGSNLTSRFGECKFAKRPITVVCKGSGMDLIEEVGITKKNEFELSYEQITGIAWDHANSELKLTLIASDEDNYVILTLSNSVEFEQELKLRLTAAAHSNRSVKNPAPMYVGMFAGATKPKPFQRKRPNLSHLATGKLPPLNEMRNTALDLHRGSYRPCPQGESRRLAIALQHIYEGHNTFPLLNVRGAASVANQYRSDSVLLISDEALIFKPRGDHSDVRVEFFFDDIEQWNAIDNDKYRVNDSGIEVTLKSSGDSIYFGVHFVRDVKHTMEYFWNSYHVNNGNSQLVKLGSTHGRPIVSVQTLSGEVPPPESPQGQTEVVDQDGLVVRPGGKMAPRRASLAAGVMSTSKEPKVVPNENRNVKRHWHKVVMHQGWLLKQGGVGVGNNKSWIKRYFVLYKTSQGHFLVYYSDFTESPMYTSEKNHRNIVDLAKATFIRPGSNKSDNPDTPPYCFDIVTTEREWTLCAESQENVQRWLQLITRAVDEDVAILPDEELVFKVKPKLDPLQSLPSTDYSTALKVSANGVSVCIPDPNVKDVGERELYFWVYTDFYKWSIMNPDGKLALLVNVFADSSFSRRYEYIFRTKEAQRLATAIEYFIEKFMSVMHIRLETQEGAFDVVEEPVATEVAPTGKRGLHEIADDDHDAHTSGQYGEELDLLGLEISDSPVPPSAPPVPPSPSGGSGFGDDPFGDRSSRPTSLRSVFATPSSASASAKADTFGGDPFGSDAFSAPAASAAPAAKVAPPLTPAQLSQHNSWWVAALSQNGGPIYDDGTLQVAARVEVRGSQCRLSLQYTNQSPASISKLKIDIRDTAGLLRLEASSLDENISGLGKATQTIMCECMKPVAPGPLLNIRYVDTLVGSRDNTVKLPLTVSSFNEPIPMEGNDFSARWGQLVGAGQERQEVLKPPYPIVPSQIQAALQSTLKFCRVQGLPDSSDYVIYGAASLKTGARTPAGEKINVGCLAKIEMNVQANAMRVTLRTLHPAASNALMETAKELLC
eukprot:scaffold3058_cov165-Ochromonas_danica.AAC.51